MSMQAAFPLPRTLRSIASKSQVSVRDGAPGFSKRLDLAALPPGAFLDEAATQNRNGRRLEDAAARTIDILLSLGMLLVLAPLMALLAVLVRLDSKGPAVYRQERLGLNGKPFTVLKFRSMRLDAEAAGPAWASLRDPRVTRIGGFLRATRLDELPQLWNVLKGDMALIGPRPERPHFSDALSAEIPHFRARLLVKPGLTGWAQVNFRYGASVEDARTKLSYDLFYVRNRNFRMNLAILFGTAKVMVCKEGR